MIHEGGWLMNSFLRVSVRRLAWLIAVVSSLGVGVAAPFAVQAQSFPTKPVHLIVPNAPGGSIDILARLFSQKLQEVWGQPVIVDYKPGVGTVLGTDYVAKSAPDGHTLGMVITGHVINPSLRSNMPFDTVKDLSGVSMTAISHVVIEATAALEANSLAELIALAKKQPGKIGYASPGSGSAMHLAGELLKSLAGIDIVHVPYKGSGPAYGDVISGRVQLMIDPLYASMPHIKAGRMKALAVTNLARSPIAPEIPTVAETIPGFDVQSINGIVVPSATPRELVHRIGSDIVRVLQSPDLKARLSELGLQPVGTTPEQFDAYIRTEIEKWAKVVKLSGAKAD
jgi:tripartite-type tricarboxylate transporter receptor subunit TctC